MILFIVSRVLFVASMVFIIGYVFGGFRQRPAITTITRIASILVVVLFIGMSIFAGRAAARNGYWHRAGNSCHYQHADSATQHY